ncbi:MAG: hypothetical protein FVQ81_06930 [Candidatus Glassbacteria bacterium]|nr:hypothetical protein [Candidatus Glassbacteria bacterium]
MHAESYRRISRLAAFAVVYLLVLASSCSKAENDPHQVAEQFIRALHTADSRLLDGLMAWDKVAISQYYVSHGYYDALTPEKQQEVLNSYKEMFFQDYLPAASEGRYSVEVVYIARGSSNAIINTEFGPQAGGEVKNTEKKRFTLEMSLIESRNRWYIIDLNNFIQLNFLRGDYDLKKFYLPEPIR